MRIYALCSMIVFIAFTSCHRHVYLSTYNGKAQPVNTGKGVDSNLYYLLTPYRDSLNKEMQQVVGFTDIALTKAQPESLLGNFMADAVYQYVYLLDTTIDIAVLNSGGIRLPLIDSGEITLGKMYELMPFDNTLTVVQMKGSTFQKFCDHMASASGWPVSNLTYTIKNKIAYDIKIKGSAIDTSLLYKVATIDYLANGGDNCTFLAGLPRKNYKTTVRDILISYTSGLKKKNMPLHPYLDKRVAHAE